MGCWPSQTEFPLVKGWKSILFFFLNLRLMKFEVSLWHFPNKVLVWHSKRNTGKRRILSPWLFPKGVISRVAYQGLCHSFVNSQLELTGQAHPLPHAYFLLRPYECVITYPQRRSSIYTQWPNKWASDTRHKLWTAAVRWAAMSHGRIHCKDKPFPYKTVLLWITKAQDNNTKPNALGKGGHKEQSINSVLWEAALSCSQKIQLWYVTTADKQWQWNSKPGTRQWLDAQQYWIRKWTD